MNAEQVDTLGGMLPRLREENRMLENQLNEALCRHGAVIMWFDSDTWETEGDIGWFI